MRNGSVGRRAGAGGSTATGIVGSQAQASRRAGRPIVETWGAARAGGGFGARTFLLLVAGLAVGVGQIRAQEGGLGLAPGTAAPDAQVEDLDGNAVSLLEVVGGGPALIEFWATWCEQCEALQPEIDAVVERFGDRVQIVAVAVGVAQSRRRVQRHVGAHDPGYPFVYDARGEAVRAYEALTTAIVVLVDAEGKVVSTGVGPQQDLVAAVAGVLGEG